MDRVQKEAGRRAQGEARVFGLAIVGSIDIAFDADHETGADAETHAGQNMIVTDVPAADDAAQ